MAVYAVATGPIRTDLTLSDGTVVDVRPDTVYLDTPGQAAEVAHLIGLRHAEKGHPLHDDSDAFVYTAPEGV